MEEMSDQIISGSRPDPDYVYKYTGPIIDFHTHTFPEAIAARALDKLQGNADILCYTEATVPTLLSSMEEAGINLSVVLPVVTAPHQHTTINRTAIALNESMEGRQGPALLSFGGIHPDNEDYKEILHGLKSAGIKGIKLHPPYLQVNIDDIRFLRLIDYASELGFVIIAHAGDDLSFPGDQAYPIRIKRMLDQVHPPKMVLAHMGGINCWDRAEELLCDGSVWLDTSFAVSTIERRSNGQQIKQLSREQFRRMLAKTGPDKILFGTDSPWTHQTAARQIIDSYLTPDEAELIFHKNAEKLLGL